MHNRDVSRRTFVALSGTTATIGLSGCTGDGDEGGSGEPDNESDENDTAEENGSEADDTGETDERLESAEGIEETVSRVNEGPIADTNRNVEAVNAKLENVEPVDALDEVEAETPDEARYEADRLESDADRLQDDIFTQVVAEINARAQEMLDKDIASEVSTPDEAREEAEKIDEEYGDAAKDAVDGLNDAADNVEENRARLNDATDALRTAADEAE